MALGVPILKHFRVNNEYYNYTTYLDILTDDCNKSNI